jgi:DNA-binding transcriptional regulator YhcF (GntR family)
VETTLDLRVDRDGELPVGIQLGWTLRAMIARGSLVPGDRMPGVRELADRAGVNVNTARAVYGRLEADGLLTSQQGRGTFVASRPAEGGELAALADEVRQRADEAGADPRELARLLYAAGAGGSSALGEGTGLPDVGREADEAAARRELRRQIGRLEAQLASYPEARSSRDRHPLLRPKAHVADLGELEAVRNQLMELLKEARATAERRGRSQDRARGRRERIIGEPEANRWRRVAREDVGDPGCGETRSVPRFGPIGAVAGWWRVKVSSGCP